MPSTPLRRSVLAALGLPVAALLVAPAPAHAADQVPSVLVVETQFWDLPSPVVSATGLFAGCTSVTTVAQAPARALQFNGRKLVDCGSGTMQIVYQAAFRRGSVSGTWTAAAGTGTLSGVRGTGTVSGSDECDVAPGSGGCVLDTWTGSLFLTPPA